MYLDLFFKPKRHTNRLYNFPQDGQKLREIDSVSRQPSCRRMIKNFVCLQSEGGATICESRQSSSLASFDITWKTDVRNVTTIVNDVLNIALSPTNMKMMSPIVQIGRSNMSNRGGILFFFLFYLHFLFSHLERRQ